jgi:hypothetical protein
MADKQGPMLVINTNSWHFRYYQRLRRFYGVETPVDKVTSLCPYCQTMIWGSVLFILTLPLQILGWLLVKVGRFLYKMAETSGLNKLVDIIDKTPLVAVLDCDDDLERHPWQCLCALGVGTVVGLGLLFFFVGVIVLAVVHGVMVLPLLPALIWAGLVHLFWGILYIGWAAVSVGWALTTAAIAVATFIGWCVLQAALGITWFFTTAWIWLLILQCVGWFLLVVSGSVLLGLATLGIGTSEWFKKGLNFLVMKFNGFHEAKDAAYKRRLAEEQARRDQGVVKARIPFSETKTGKVLTACWRKVTSPFVALANVCWSYEIDTEGVKKKVMGPFSVAWAFFWAVKHQVCPMVSFVDVESAVAKEAELKAVVTAVTEECAKEGIVGGEPTPEVLHDPVVIDDPKP